MSNGNDVQDNFQPAEGLSSPRELVVVAHADSGLRASPEEGVRSLNDADVSDVEGILSEMNATMEPLFGISEVRMLEAAAAETTERGAEMERAAAMYSVQAPEEVLDELAERLQAQAVVDTAYVKPGGEPPIAPPPEEVEGEVVTPQPLSFDEAPAVTPNYVSRQTYLNAAPAGIDARYAWTVSGGRGQNVNIIDLEWGWRFTHEDLLQNQGGVLAGTNSSNSDHGTAVIGEIGGDVNSLGITGICPDARVSAVAFSMPTARAIRTAADRLRSGDIMLLEIHRAGPRLNFQPRLDQRGYVAIEWWPDDYLAIRYAINKGIIVVEAAGNGRENLDDAIYNTNPNPPFGPFPGWWRNPYRRNPLDSGAIVVGAGAPPPGTHGRNHGPDRSRLDFSNYGRLVDAQGYGREVTTTGYGNFYRDPDDSGNADRWYSDTFSGTSSASPIVTGALGCVQGVLRRRGRIPLSPTRARDLLRASGSPQQDAPGRPRTERIGNRPNLRQLISSAVQTRSWTGVQFRGSVGPNQTRRWFTWGWPAHWFVLWTVVPTSPRRGAPQIGWDVALERASDRHITYWITIRNHTSSEVAIEARYAVLGW